MHKACGGCPWGLKSIDATDAPGIHDDLAALFRWLRLTFKGSPSGNIMHQVPGGTPAVWQKSGTLSS
eukprot:402120-Pelagomonas_calceolata.AAC.2